MPAARSGAAVVRQTRLWLGLVLFTYLTTHFVNHALGLVSIDAMLAGREWFVLLWRSYPGTLALYTALLVHLSLAYWSLYRRARSVCPDGRRCSSASASPSRCS